MNLESNGLQILQILKKKPQYLNLHSSGYFSFGVMRDMVGSMVLSELWFKHSLRNRSSD